MRTIFNDAIANHVIRHNPPRLAPFGLPSGCRVAVGDAMPTVPSKTEFCERPSHRSEHEGKRAHALALFPRLAKQRG
jgi:hypothetical protein